MMHARPLEGLTSEEARRRLADVGPNALPKAAATPLWRRFVRQFQSPLIYILLFALAFDIGAWTHAGAMGWPVEAVVIAAVLLLNAGLGTFQEQRSEQALAQLAALAAPQAWVLRDGKLVHLPSQDLVPGDVIRIEAGERIPADGAVVEAQGVMIDESVLTGESAPVDKAIDDEAFSGTLMVRGKGHLHVTATGQTSNMGKLATMLGGIVAEKTPLEKRLNVLGHQIARWVGVLAVGLAVAGLLTEGLGRFDEVVLFAVALAVAAVPEGMPAVVTLTLALGVQRMARRKAVVRRLTAVEALGSVTVIATDKTGTLTENRMVVRELESADAPAALLAMTLANDADTDGLAGDPLELGLLEYARSGGLDVAEVRGTHRRVESRPFDSAWKFMRVTVDQDGQTRSYLKGAPEVLLQRSTLAADERAEWIRRADAGAERGHRVLGLAMAAGEAEEGLEFLGLVMLWDPPRQEVPAAIASAQSAGVRVVMITGDHPGTARAVATTIGMTSVDTLVGADIEHMSAEALGQAVRTASVFARVSPAHKLRLVEALEANGEIVAMTGDGVNDAPALKRAAVGIAMGQRGSDVAREVADLVLLDDNFATLVGAIEEGRSIYENIQSFIRFTFSTNVALILLIVAGAVGSYALDLRDATGMLLLPLTALQLLWINFLGDGPPALALALDRNPGVMTRPPRPAKSPLLDRASARFIGINGLFKGLLGISLLLVLPALGYTLTAVVTLIFLYESIGKLVSVYPARKLFQRPSNNAILHACVGLAVVLQILTVVVPGLRELLSLTELDLRAAAILVGAVVVTWGVAELSCRRRGASARTSAPA